MSEKRYIDKARLIKAIEDLPNCYNGFSDTFDKACIIGVIEELPTIDPVKYGKWIDRRSIVAMNRYECSACKRTASVDEFMGKPMYAYCPWCGARMEGEE